MVVVVALLLESPLWIAAVVAVDAHRLPYQTGGSTPATDVLAAVVVVALTQSMSQQTDQQEDQDSERLPAQLSAQEE